MGRLFLSSAASYWISIPSVTNMHSLVETPKRRSGKRKVKSHCECGRACRPGHVGILADLDSGALSPRPPRGRGRSWQHVGCGRGLVALRLHSGGVPGLPGALWELGILLKLADFMYSFTNPYCVPGTWRSCEYPPAAVYRGRSFIAQWEAERGFVQRGFNCGGEFFWGGGRGVYRLLSFWSPSPPFLQVD